MAVALAKFRWRGDDLIKAVNAAVDETLRYSGAKIVRDAKRLAPAGVTGNLRRSINYRFHRRGSQHYVNIGFIGGESGEFRYQMAMELGAQWNKGKKMPPPAALYRWVEMKLGAGRTATATGYQRARSNRQAAPSREKEIRAIAFLVARAIGRRGLKPRLFLTRAFNQNRPMVMNLLRAAFDAHLGRLR